MHAHLPRLPSHIRLTYNSRDGILRMYTGLGDRVQLSDDERVHNDGRERAGGGKCVTPPKKTGLYTIIALVCLIAPTGSVVIT